MPVPAVAVDVAAEGRRLLPYCSSFGVPTRVKISLDDFEERARGDTLEGGREEGAACDDVRAAGEGGAHDRCP